jgi:hypothetical protein
MTAVQVACSAESGDRRGLGILALEDDRLLFDGAFRLVIPLLEIDLLRVHRGSLRVTWAGGEAMFDLGPRRAQQWAGLIREPRSLLDSLGVRPGARAIVAGISDLGFRRRLKSRASAVVDRATAAGEPVDVVFLGVGRPEDLAAVASYEPLLARDGALWVVRPKEGSGVSVDDVIGAGRNAGLTDVKVAAFSLTHTAHKFVVPLARR